VLFFRASLRATHFHERRQAAEMETRRVGTQKAREGNNAARSGDFYNKSASHRRDKGLGKLIPIPRLALIMKKRGVKYHEVIIICLWRYVNSKISCKHESTAAV
jgi:hypothetical protein